MREKLTDIVNEAVVMFAVGLLLALAAPHLGNVLGVSPTIIGKQDPLWGGAFFGAFGAIHAVMAPVLAEAFGGKSPAAKAHVKEREPAREKELAPQINITIQTEPQKEKAVNWKEYVQANAAEIGQDSPSI